MPLTLAVDLGGTNMRVAVVDERGGIVARDHAPTPHDAPTIDPFLELLIKMRAAHDVEHGVVAVPGRVDHLAGTLLHAPNLPPKWLTEISRDAIQRALDLPIVLANDADAAAVGEAHFGAGRGHPDVVYLTISTGVGAGVLVGGRLVQPRFSAGEVGHTVIDRMAAAAGSPATVEALGSGTAIARLAAARGLSGGGREIAEMARAGVGRPRRPTPEETPSAASTNAAGVGRPRRPTPEETPSAASTNAAGVGDLVAREVWDEAMFAAGLGAVTLAHLYAPSVIVVGGGVGLNTDLTLAPIRDVLERFGPLGPPVNVVGAALGDDPGLIGAAGWRAATGA